MGARRRAAWAAPYAGGMDGATTDVTPAGPGWRTWLPRAALAVGGLAAAGFVALFLLAMR